MSDADGNTLADKHLKAEESRDVQGALDVIFGSIEPTLACGILLSVGHRVVHGGSEYSSSVAVDRVVLDKLHRLTPLAPLHQPFSLACIEAVFARLPDVPQVACFDTAFHTGRAEVTRILPLPWEMYQNGLQRYGFHGLSYQYIASALPQVAPEVANGRIVVAHLGNGASPCAIKDGRSVDCTFSFTALDGLCMGTRPGTVDPGAILYLFQNLKLSAEQVETILYKESGLLGISGISSDMRDLLGSDTPRARVAIDYFIYRVAKEIGALAAVLGGLDALVFTAGIGENSSEIRRRVCESCAWLGVDLYPAANVHGNSRISPAGSRVSAWVIPTNEELVIARETARLVGASTVSSDSL